jgi:hypothetical protein
MLTCKVSISFLLAISLNTVPVRAQWFPNGSAISTANFNQESPDIVSDGAGGAIITWIDQRNGDWDVYAQRVSPYGELLWNPPGVPVVTALENQIEVAATADGSGGAIVVWVNDTPSLHDRDLHAQHVNASGSLSWRRRSHIDRGRRPAASRDRSR